MKKSPNEHYVRFRLNHWAAWVIYLQTGHLGYHRENVLYKMRKCCGEWIPATIDSDFENDWAEEVEAIVCAMREKKAILADVVKQEYLRQGTQRSKAEFIDIRLTQYRHYLEVAHTWVEAMLCGPKAVSDVKQSKQKK